MYQTAYLNLAEVEVNNCLFKIQKGKDYFEEEWKVDKFDDFIMRTSSKDVFDQNSQIYFCYGRLSNRMMLMRYGMALLYNKYDHFYLRLPFINQLPECMIPEVTTYNISKYRRFKIKPTFFNVELIYYIKSTMWKIWKNDIKDIFYITDLKQEILALQ